MNLADKLVATCKHFNGIQHDVCEAGINYRELVGNERGAIRCLPCLPKTNSLGPLPGMDYVDCPKLEYMTREEAEQQETESEAELARVLAAIANSECPTCGKQVVKKQVGPCVYGSCGHRLYQGRA